MATAARKGSEVTETVERIASELWSDGNVDVIGELYATDCVVHSGPEVYRGHDGVRQWVLDTREAFPDLALELGEIHATDAFAATTWHMTGTHEGRFKPLGLDPTGKEVEMNGVVLARFEDGKIVEERGQGDQVSLLAQLGIIEPPTG